MAIATITPVLNQTQTSLLAQALNGSTGTLAQAINSAIQRGMQDGNFQLQQENAFMDEQQRNIGNERAERFDKRNRAQWLMNYASNERQEQVNDGINLDREARAKEEFGFQRDDRAKAEELGVTAPENLARQENRLAEDQVMQAEENARLADLQESKLDFEKKKIESAAGEDMVMGSYLESAKELQYISDPAEKAAAQKDILDRVRTDDRLSGKGAAEIIERLSPGGSDASADDSGFTEVQRNAMLQKVSEIDAELAGASEDSDDDKYLPPARRQILERERARLSRQAREGRLTVDSPATKRSILDGLLSPASPQK